MQKIIVTIGISGSGKSTFAADFIRKNKGYVRINRDSLREQLTGLKACEYNKSPNGKIEKIINDLQHEQIRYFLNKGLNVIIDNTHLKQSYINEILEKYGHLCDVELKWFYCSSVQAKINVYNRDFNPLYSQTNGGDLNYIERQLGQFDIFRKQITQDYYDKTNYIITQNKALPHAIICDLDGTLAEAPGGQLEKWHFDRDYSKDFVIEPIKDLVLRYEFIGTHILFVSGREDKYKSQTEDFLYERIGIFNYKLFMRKTGDNRRDSIIKQEIFDTYIRDKYYILFTLDDRKQVKEECWNKLGIFMLDVNQTDNRY